MLISRVFACLFLTLGVTACGAPEKRALTPPSVHPPTAPDHVTLAGHVDRTHATFVVALQDLDRASERLLTTLETMPESVRREVEPIVSRAKIQAKLGFDPTHRAGWDDVGLDPAAGALVVSDDRFDVGEDRAGKSGDRQIVVFLRLTDVAKWKAKIVQAGATLTEDGEMTVVQLGEDVLWMTPSGTDVAIAPMPKLETPAAKAQFRKAFLAVTALPAQSLATEPGWQGALRDAGRPWVVVWRPLAPDWLPARVGTATSKTETATLRHVAALFPAMVGWLGDGWSMQLLTTPASHAALADVFEPRKLAPACAALLPATGWAGVRLSLKQDTMADGLMRLLPPSVGPLERATLQGWLMMGPQWVTGLPSADVAAAWSGHLCAAVEIAAVPGLLQGAGMPPWLAVLGVQDETRADAFLAALATYWRTQLNVPVQQAQIAGLPGYTGGPFQLAVVRDHDRVILGASAQVITDALARQATGNLAKAGLGEALDGHVAAGVLVDLRTVFDVVGTSLQAMTGHDDRMQSTLESMGSMLGAARFFGVALKVEPHALVLEPAVAGDAGLSAPLLVGMLAALAIPSFQQYAAREKAAEAKQNLHEIRNLAIAFWQTPRVDAQTGQALPARFPQTTLLTPAQSCCDPANDRDGDQRCDADATPWQQTGWREMGFQPAGQHRFRYTFESSGTGDNATFAITAVGDVDCDGHESTFQLSARPCKGKGCKDKWRFEERESSPTD